MGQNVVDLGVRITADLSDIRAALKGLQGDLDTLKKPKASAGGDPTGLEGPLGRVKTLAQSVIATLGVAAGVRAFVRTADDMQNLYARLKLAEQGTGDYVQAQQDVVRISQDTRSALEPIGDLYTKITRASATLGTSQAQTAAITEVVAKSLKISGASAEETSASILQLSQAFSSGVLQGDEFKSLAETSPRLLKAIADGANVPIGALKQLGAEGKLTAGVIAEALLKSKASIDAEFASIPSTAAGAVTQIGNTLKGLVEDANESTGATHEIVDALGQLNTTLGSPGFKTGFDIIVAGLVKVIDLSSKAVSALGQVTQFAAEEVASRVGGPAIDDIVRIQESLDRETEKLKNTAVLPELLGIQTKAYDDQLAKVHALVQELSAAQRIEADRANQAKNNAGAKPAADAPVSAAGIADNSALNQSKNLQQTLQGELATLKQQVATYGQGKAALVEYQKQQALSIANNIKDADKRKEATAAVEKSYAPLLEQAKALDKVTQAKKDDAKATPIEQEQRAAAVIAANTASLKGLADSYGDGLVKIKDYYTQKATLETASIDASIRQAQAEKDVANTAVASANAQAKINQLQAQRAAIGPAAAREQAKAEQELGVTIRGVYEDYLNLNNQQGLATRLQLEDQYHDLIQRLKTEGDTAGVQLIQGLINTKESRAQLDAIKTQYTETLQQLQAQEQSIANSVTIGAKSSVEAENEVNTARDAARTKMQALVDQVHQLADATGDPQIKQAFVDLQNQTFTATQQVDALGNAFKNGFQTGLANALDGLINKTETLGEAARGVLGSILESLAQIGEQAVAEAAFDALKNAFGGGGDKSNPTTNVATSAAAGAAYAAPVSLAGATLTAAGATVSGGGAAVLSAAIALQAAADTLLIANSLNTAASVAHMGASSGGGAKRSGVSPWLFAGARRYHQGSGLHPGEIPAILKQGERVLNPMETQQYNQGLGQAAGAGGGIRIINAIDPDFVSDNLGTPQNERIIMNLVRKNDRSGRV